MEETETPLLKVRVKEAQRRAYIDRSNRGTGTRNGGRWVKARGRGLECPRVKISITFPSGR